MDKPKITLAFLGNLNYDSRCRNLFTSLNENGFETSFIGFDWQTENFQSHAEKSICITKLTKQFSPFFYIKFALILILKLFQAKSKVFFAEDIYTLPFICFVAFVKRAKVVYDSRELYGYIAGLAEKQLVQSMLKKIEAIFIKRVSLVLVTGDLDREFLMKQYSISNVKVLRNLPFRIKNLEKIDLHKLLGIEKNYRILLYQGVILHGRGLGILINTIKHLDDFVLVVIGEGEQYDHYRTIAENENLGKRIFFIGKVSYDKLLSYTKSADIGTALIENLSLSYYYALPNKLFEYIMCGVPVLVSSLPQMEKIVHEYNVGQVVDITKTEEVVASIKEISDPLVHKNLVNNCTKASKELNWEREFSFMLEILKKWG